MDRLTDERNLRLEKLEQALRASEGFVNDHDYITHVRPVDVREALQVIAQLRHENERLRSKLDMKTFPLELIHLREENERLREFIANIEELKRASAG